VNWHGSESPVLWSCAANMNRSFEYRTKIPFKMLHKLSGNSTSFFFIFFELKGTRELLKGKREMIKMHEELLCKWIYHTYYITKKLLVLNFLEKYKNAYTFGEVLLWNSLFFYVRKGYHAIYIIQQVSKREWNVSILPLDIGGRTNKTSWHI